MLFCLTFILNFGKYNLYVMESEEEIKEVKTDRRIENQFWKQRSKHGRDKLFVTPDLMLEAAYEYFKWVDENPLYRAEWKDGGLVDIPVKRPYTIQGLCMYLDCNTAYFRVFKSQLGDLDTQEKKDFNTVITHCEDVIYRQKFEGASSGFFNANIIARDLGLKDTTTNELTGLNGAAIAINQDIVFK